MTTFQHIAAAADEVVAEKSESMVKYPTVKVRLSGRHGNVFSIISRVSQALKRAGQPEAAEEFATAAMNAHSYDEVLQLCMRTVDVR